MVKSQVDAASITELARRDLAAEPIPTNPAEREQELALLARALSAVQGRGDAELAAKLEARIRALAVHPGSPRAAARPSIATRVETFLRQETEQRGTSWIVLAILLALLVAALVIYEA